MIELTPEQLRALDEANGSPPVVIDSRTKQTYLLVRAEACEKPRKLEPKEQSPQDPPIVGIPEMSEGIRRSKRALRQDLPKLLASRRYRGKMVCYHLEERVGISKDYFALIRECIKRDIPDDEFIVETIEPGAGSEEELEL